MHFRRRRWGQDEISLLKLKRKAFVLYLLT
jgi:hypothetical protein